MSFFRSIGVFLAYFWGSGMAWDAQGMKGYPYGMARVWLGIIPKGAKSILIALTALLRAFGQSKPLG